MWALLQFKRLAAEDRIKSCGIESYPFFGKSPITPRREICAALWWVILSYTVACAIYAHRGKYDGIHWTGSTWNNHKHCQRMIKPRPLATRTENLFPLACLTKGQMYREGRGGANGQSYCSHAAAAAAAYGWASRLVQLLLTAGDEYEISSWLLTASISALLCRATLVVQPEQSVERVACVCLWLCVLRLCPNNNFWTRRSLTAGDKNDFDK